MMSHPCSISSTSIAWVLVDFTFCLADEVQIWSEQEAIWVIGGRKGLTFKQVVANFELVLVFCLFNERAKVKATKTLIVTNFSVFKLSLEFVENDFFVLRAFLNSDWNGLHEHSLIIVIINLPLLLILIVKINNLRLLLLPEKQNYLQYIKMLLSKVLQRNKSRAI